MIDDLFDPNAPWVQFLGRLHPMVLHLPIGLWIGIAFLEFGGLLVRRQPSRAVVVSLAWFATACAAVTAGAGWLLALEGEHGGRSLEFHRWLGVAVAGTGALAAVFACLRVRAPFRLLLVAVLGLLFATGHFGNSLTRHDGYLLEPFAEKPARPAARPADPAADPAADPPAHPPATEVDPSAGALTFAHDVQPVLNGVCTKCHNQEKHKGRLVLVDRAGIEHGGKHGKVVLADKTENSPLLQRALAPADDEDHMPPTDEKQPTAAELAVLRAWIAAGAPFEGAFAADAPKTAAPKNNAPAPAVEQQPQAEPPANKEPAKPEPAKTDPPKADPPKTGAPNPAALAALQQANVHVQLPPPGSAGLQIDFAPCAVAMTEAEAKTLLTPLVEHVADLGLARVPVGDGICALCAKMPLLERLDLRNTAVTSKGVQQLQTLPKLKELVLAQTKLDDTAVDPLLAMPSLTKVYVWNAGLSVDALARLRGKQGLVVDAGDAPPAKALETEGDLKFVNELPPSGQKAPPPEVAAALRPVNDVCPVSGKPVDPRFVIVHGGKAIGFCCPNCPKEFWTEPTKFAVKER